MSDFQGKNKHYSTQRKKNSARRSHTPGRNDKLKPTTQNSKLTTVNLINIIMQKPVAAEVNFCFVFNGNGPGRHTVLSGIGHIV